MLKKIESKAGRLKILSRINLGTGIDKITNLIKKYTSVAIRESPDILQIRRMQSCA